MQIVTIDGVLEVREARRVIWWNVAVGLCAAMALLYASPSYKVFILLFLALRIIAILFEYMLYVAFRRVSIFTKIPGIAYAWGAAFLSTVAAYSYQVGESAFHYGLTVSPLYEIPSVIFQSIEAIALIFLGYYFGKLPLGYGKIAFWARITHTVFGIALIADLVFTVSANFALVSHITHQISIMLFFPTILIEYIILSRTLNLIPLGDPSLLLAAMQEPRNMFDHMGDFGYIRSAKQAIGFYFVYLITIFVSYILLVIVLRLIFPTFDYVGNATVIGSLSSTIVCVLLAFIVTRERHALKRFSSIFLLILTLLVALYGKLGAGLAIVAYMSTRRAGGSVVTTSAPTPSPLIFPAPAPFPPHHDPTHLALIENDIDQVEDVHVSIPARAQVKKVRTLKRAPAKKLATADVTDTKPKPALTEKRVRKSSTRAAPPKKTALEKQLERELAAPIKDETKIKNIVITSPVIRDAG